MITLLSFSFINNDNHWIYKYLIIIVIIINNNLAYSLTLSRYFSILLNKEFIFY